MLVGFEFLRFKERVTVIEERAIKFLYLGEESLKQSFIDAYAEVGFTALDQICFMLQESLFPEPSFCRGEWQTGP